MHMKKSLLAAAMTLAVAASAVPAAGIQAGAAATKSIESQMNWDTVTISGGGFVSGLITGGTWAAHTGTMQPPRNGNS